MSHSKLSLLDILLPSFLFLAAPSILSLFSPPHRPTQTSQESLHPYLSDTVTCAHHRLSSSKSHTQCVFSLSPRKTVARLGSLRPITRSIQSEFDLPLEGLETWEVPLSRSRHAQAGGSCDASLSTFNLNEADDEVESNYGQDDAGAWRQP
jgi:hypothetical protein